MTGVRRLRKTRLYWQQFRRKETAFDPSVAILRFGILLLIAIGVEVFSPDQFLRKLFFIIGCASVVVVALLLFRRKRIA